MKEEKSLETQLSKIRDLLEEGDGRKIIPCWKKLIMQLDERIYTDDCMIDKEAGAVYSQILQMYEHEKKLPEQMYDWFSREEFWETEIRKDIGKSTKGFCLRDKLVANILYEAGAGNRNSIWVLTEKAWGNLRTMVSLYMEESRYEEKINRVILFLIQDIADLLDDGMGRERSKVGWLETQTALVDQPYEKVKAVIEDLYGYARQRS